MVAEPLGDVAGDTDPQEDVEQVTVQVTPMLLASIRTVAIKGLDEPASTVAEVGAMLTATEGTVIVADAVLVGSATEVEVIVTDRLAAGGVAGAVYVVDTPFDVEFAETEPQGGVGQDSVQLT